MCGLNRDKCQRSLDHLLKRVYCISATEALIILNKTLFKELSFELNILSNQTGQVKVEIDELVAQKENVYKFTLQNIEGTRATKS